MKTFHTSSQYPNKHRLKQHAIYLCTVLIATLLLCVFFVPGRHALAFVQPLSQQAQGQTCASNPSATLCNNQDPIQQGCVTPATQTLKSRAILYLGRVVGRVDQRYSARCRSYWGRAFAYVPGNVHITIVSPVESTFTAETSSAYSNMVFAQPPSISGSIDVSATAVAAAAIFV